MTEVKMKEELTITIASTELPAEERSKAKEQMDELNEIAQKEVLLETLIKAMDYEDVLVRADRGASKYYGESRKTIKIRSK